MDILFTGAVALLFLAMIAMVLGCQKLGERQ